MPYLSTLILSLFLALPCVASGDAVNNPTQLRKEILASQFIFIGKLSVKDYRFFDSDLKVIDDIRGEVWKAYTSDRFKQSETLPTSVQIWSEVKVVSMLRGKVELLQPFLHESWCESTLSMCPHHSEALIGEERIWLLVVHEDFKAAELVSMSTIHREAVINLVNEKKGK